MKLSLKIRYLLPPLSLGAWGCLLLQLYLSGQLSQLQNPAYHSITFFFSVLLISGCIGYPFLFDIPSGNNSFGGFHLLAQSVLLFPLIAFLSLPEDLLTPDFLRQRSTPNLLSPGALQRFLPGKPGELHQALLDQVQSASPEDAVSLDLLELVYLSQDSQLRSLYNGKTVIIPGQWLSDDSGHFKIARLLIFCCAADGRTVTLRVAGKTHIHQDGSWIEVTGILKFNADTPVPELELKDYSKIEGPPDAGM